MHIVQSSVARYAVRLNADYSIARKNVLSILINVFPVKCSFVAYRDKYCSKFLLISQIRQEIIGTFILPKFQNAEFTHLLQEKFYHPKS